MAEKDKNIDQIMTIIAKLRFHLDRRITCAVSLKKPVSSYLHVFFWYSITFYARQNIYLNFPSAYTLKSDFEWSVTTEWVC